MPKNQPIPKIITKYSTDFLTENKAAHSTNGFTR
uniref:Uncharacterized protein n=1 Tax=Anguilla anguilla TaxID=7936 RepID=A0A0E9UM45_ANGAN